MSSWRCVPCGAENDTVVENCSFCSSIQEVAAPNAETRQRSPRFRQAKAMEQILVHQKRSSESPVIRKLQKGDRVSLGRESSDISGQRWIEVEIASGKSWRAVEQGFALKSSRVSAMNPALALGVIGGCGVVLMLIGYQVVHAIRESSISVSRLAMVVLGIYGAYVGLSRRKG